MATRGINKVILVGNLGADPEIRYSQSGTAVATLSVATTERVSAGEGNWEDRTEWHRVVAFGKTAENCGNYLNKGSQVYLEGRLQTRQWEDAQGTKRYTTEIVARDVLFLGRAGDRAPQTQGNQAPAKTADASASGGSFKMEELPPAPNAKEDEIPF